MQPAQSTTATPTTGTAVSVGTTPRLVLSGADIDQQVVPGGLSEQGTISPPRGTLMWYDGNTRVAPGKIGTSLIAAHVSYGDDDDVFARLDQVEVGPGRPGQWHTALAGHPRRCARQG